jgi:hypothetical protein
MIGPVVVGNIIILLFLALDKYLGRKYGSGKMP